MKVAKAAKAANYLKEVKENKNPTKTWILATPIILTNSNLSLSLICPKEQMQTPKGFDYNLKEPPVWSK